MVAPHDREIPSLIQVEVVSARDPVRDGGASIAVI
jgi:hypothetical protein